MVLHFDKFKAKGKYKTDSYYLEYSVPKTLTIFFMGALSSFSNFMVFWVCFFLFVFFSFFFLQ